MYEIIHKDSNFENYTVTDNHILTLKASLHKTMSYNEKLKVIEVARLTGNAKYEYISFNDLEDAEKYKNRCKKRISK